VTFDTDAAVAGFETVESLELDVVDPGLMTRSMLGESLVVRVGDRTGGLEDGPARD
jgi:hypothetical protein